MLRGCNLVETLHEEVGCGVLHPGQIDEAGLLVGVDPVDSEFAVAVLEHLQRQLGQRKLVEVGDDEPFLYLSLNKHISRYVGSIKVVDGAKALRTDLLCLKQLLQVLEVHHEDGVPLLRPSMDVEQPMIETVQGVIR